MLVTLSALERLHPTASRPRTARWRSLAAPPPAALGAEQDRFFRTSSCAGRDRSSACAGSAARSSRRHRPRSRRPARRPSVPDPSAPVDRVPPECACPLPPCRSASRRAGGLCWRVSMPAAATRERHVRPIEPPRDRRRGPRN